MGWREKFRVSEIPKWHIALGAVIYAFLAHRFLVWLEHTGVSPLELFYRKTGAVIIGPLSSFASLFPEGGHPSFAGIVFLLLYVPFLLVEGIVVATAVLAAWRRVAVKTAEWDGWKRTFLYACLVLIATLMLRGSYVFIEFGDLWAIYGSVIAHAIILGVVPVYRQMKDTRLVQRSAAKLNNLTRGMVVGGALGLFIGAYSLLLSYLYTLANAQNFSSGSLPGYVGPAVAFVVYGIFFGALTGMLHSRFPLASRAVLLTGFAILGLMLPVFLHGQLDDAAILRVVVTDWPRHILGSVAHYAMTAL